MKRKPIRSVGFREFLEKVIGIESANISLHNMKRFRIQNILDSLGLVGHGILQKKRNISRRNLLELRFGLNYQVHTIKEIAEGYRLSSTAIARQIEKSIELLKSPVMLRQLKEAASGVKQSDSSEKKPLSETRVDDRHILSTRTANCLKNARIVTIADLAGKGVWEMHRVKNCGAKTLRELNGILADYGLKFKK
ncbi:MAG: DNA-directed RNA polymerase subunit alpha C-terminal domain-containing protein [Candidatus Moraniibacteriota bacterium]